MIDLKCHTMVQPTVAVMCIVKLKDGIFNVNKTHVRRRTHDTDIYLFFILKIYFYNI